MAESIVTTSGDVPSPCTWNRYIDGSCTKDRSGADLVIESPGNEQHEHALKFMFTTSNNKAKYETLIAGIEQCYTTGVDSVQAFSDS